MAAGELERLALIVRLQPGAIERGRAARHRLINQPADDLAFERIVNTPRRGIGTASLQLLHAAARAQGASLVEATRSLIAGDDLPRAASNGTINSKHNAMRWLSLIFGASEANAAPSYPIGPAGNVNP